MKIYKLIILLSITNILFAQQNGVVKYKFSYKKNNETPKNITIAKARKTVEMSAEYARDHEYVLKFNSIESYYFIEASMPIDGVDNELAYKFSKYIFGKGTYYQNKLSQESLNQQTTMNNLYLIKDAMVNDWEITTEYKYIGNYKSYKAVSICGGCNNNQIITAWFTNDIPIPFGPAGYGGLPGLILEVSKFRYTLNLKKIKLTDKTIIIEKPTEGILITADNLKELQSKRRMEIKNFQN